MINNFIMRRFVLYTGARILFHWKLEWIIVRKLIRKTTNPNRLIIKLKTHIRYERHNFLSVKCIIDQVHCRTTETSTRAKSNPLTPNTKTAHAKIANRGVMISCSSFFTYYSSPNNNVCISAMFDLGTEREHLTEEWSEYYIRARNNGVARAEPTNTKFPLAPYRDVIHIFAVSKTKRKPS